MRFPLLLPLLLPLLMPILLVASLGAAAPAHAHPATGEMPSLAPLVKEGAPAVVNIATRGEAEMPAHPFFDNPFFKEFFGDRPPPRPQPRQRRAAGSGVIVDAERGFLLTNHHVIDGADEITVTLTDRRDSRRRRWWAPTPKPTSPCSRSRRST